MLVLWFRNKFGSEAKSDAAVDVQQTSQRTSAATWDPKNVISKNDEFAVECRIKIWSSFRFWAIAWRPQSRNIFRVPLYINFSSFFVAIFMIHRKFLICRLDLPNSGAFYSSKSSFFPRKTSDGIYLRFSPLINMLRSKLACIKENYKRNIIGRKSLKDWKAFGEASRGLWWARFLTCIWD